MNTQQNITSDDVLVYLTPSELDWLEYVFRRFNGQYPTLDEIWLLMDEAWTAHHCDSEATDKQITAFYKDPVWLLNGLFVEQDALSQNNRRLFAEWIVEQKPRRVADYGGGFGGLARTIGESDSDCIVEIIEPHPHRAGIALAMKTRNVRYQPELKGEYDFLVATDVFEHVPDPLKLVHDTAQHLRIGGQYLIGNCFWPVIRCHLPECFHFRYSWGSALKAMGLVPGDNVSYAQAFIRRSDSLSLHSARIVERRSRMIYSLLGRMPERIRRRIFQLTFR